MKKKVVIIGSGVGGLATAALLAKDGFQVTVVEKNTQAGGRMRTIKSKGFIFDMGPSWYLMPEVFDRYFALFGKKTNDYYHLKKLNPQYKIFWDKKDYVTITNSLEKTIAYFETLEQGVGTRIRSYLDNAHRLYALAIHSFLYKEKFGVKEGFLLLQSFLKVLPYLFTSVDSHLQSFTKNYRIRQILSYWSVFLGASPYALPAIYSMMADVDLQQGVYYPMGGMRSVIEALLDLCRKYKVRIITGCTAEKIIVKDGKAIGVKTNKGDIVADIIISNADYPTTEMKLLPQRYTSYPRSYWKKKAIAPSMFLLYLGVKGKLPQLKHHNFYFSSDWKKHFRQISTQPAWPDDPSYYMCKPSATDSTVMPKNTENLFVLVPISPFVKDSPGKRKLYRDKVIKHMEELLSVSLEDKLLYEKIYTINDFIADYQAFSGTALGLSHTLLQSAVFRPRMQSKKVNNLYYVGQYTVPGTGVPMCIISAELLSAKIVKKYTYERAK